MIKFLKKAIKKIKDWLTVPPPIEEPPAPPPPPPPVRDYCLDMSNFWLPGVVSDFEARARMSMAKEAGYGGIIAGTQVPSVCNQQIKAALAIGMWADVYHYVQWGVGMRYQADAILYAIDDVRDKVNVVWIDLEQIPPLGWSNSDVLDSIFVMVDYLLSKGCVVGIYTRRLWWLEMTSNSEQFKHLMLWPTDYDHSPPFNQSWWDVWHFGGWSAPTWVQFHANVSIAGMNVDVNERYVA